MMKMITIVAKKAHSGMPRAELWSNILLAHITQAILNIMGISKTMVVEWKNGKFLNIPAWRIGVNLRESYSNKI